MDRLPNEIVDHILTFLSIKFVKIFSRVSKRFYDVSQRRIWNRPRFGANVHIFHISNLLKTKPILDIQNAYCHL